MSNKTREDAENILQRYLSRIEGCIRQGHHEFLEEYPKRFFYRQSTKASVIRDHIVYLIHEEFHNEAHVQLIEKRGQFLLRVRDIVIRFKKLNKQLRTSYLPTRQSLAFETQLRIPGMLEDFTNVNAGYVVDPTGAGLLGVFLTCPDGKELRWVLELRSQDASTSSTGVVPQPIPVQPRLVKPKETHSRKIKNE